MQFRIPFVYTMFTKFAEKNKDVVIRLLDSTGSISGLLHTWGICLTWGTNVILAYCHYYLFCYHYKIIFESDN